MGDAHWTSYVGMATGIAGAVMGFFAYRKSTQIKALDLRLELRKADNEFAATITKLGKLLPYANQSRERVAPLTVGRNSGAMVLWKESFEADMKQLEELRAQRANAEETYAGLSPNQLETNLVRTHRLQTTAAALVSKYEGTLSADDEARKQNSQTWRDIQNRSR